MFFAPKFVPHEAVIQLHTADHLVYLRANQLLRQYGITMQQALILHYLSLHRREEVNQKSLELYLGISNPSVTSLMKTMVNKHLVQRLPDRKDARSYLIRPTEQGLRLQKLIAPIFSQLAQEMQSGLSSDELHQLMYLLSKISDNLASSMT